MQNRTQGIQPLFKSVLLLLGTLISLAAFAAPQLVTPQLPPGIQGQTYTASLFIGSSLALSSAGATGLPAGMTATHNGSGTLADGIPMQRNARPASKDGMGAMPAAKNPPSWPSPVSTREGSARCE